MGSVGCKKEAQCDSCGSSFIWGKMRTIAWETASQIALRNSSREVGRRSVLHMILVRWVHAAKYTFWQRLTAHCKEQMSQLMILVLFLDMRRCKNWAHKIWKYLTIEADLFCHFPQNTECLLHSWSPPWTLCRGCWRSAAPEVHDLILVEVYGKCQSVVGRRENHIYVEDILNTLYKIYHLSSLLQSS